MYPWTGTVGILSALEIIDTNTPLVTLSDLDVDNDLLSEEKEEQIGTDPRNWDSDHDRMGDAWEYAYSGLKKAEFVCDYMSRRALKREVEKRRREEKERRS